MRTSKLNLGFLVLLIFCSVRDVNAAVVTWIGGSGDWNIGANWTNTTLPGPNDDVVIDVFGDVTVTHSSGTHSVRSLQCQEALVLSGGSLTVSNTVQVNNGFSLSGGALVGATVLQGTNGVGLRCTSLGGTLDGVTVNGDLALTGDHDVRVSVTNGLTLNGTATIGASGFSAIRMEFMGSQTLGGNGTVVFGDAVTYGPMLRVVNSGTTLTIGPGITVRRGGNNDGAYNDGAYIGANPSFGGETSVTVINRGTIAADTGVRIIRIRGQSFLNQGLMSASNGGVLDISLPSTNVGQIAVQSGTLNLGGNWINTGTINANNATVNLGGAFTLAALGTFSRVGGIVNLIGTLDNRNTTLTLNATSGSWVLGGGSIQGGTINIGDGAQLILTSLGGTLDEVTVNGDLALTGDHLVRVSVTNGLTLNGTATIGASGFSAIRMEFMGSQTLGGNGTVVFGDAVTYGPMLRVVNSGTTLTIGPGITVRRGGNNDGAYNDGAYIGANPSFGGETSVSVINRGTIAADTGGRIIRIRGQSFLNQGLMSASNGGVLEAIDSSSPGTGSIQAPANGTVIHHGSATFSGGSYLASQPSGTVRFGGNLLGGTQNPLLFVPQGTTTLDGSGSAVSPQLLEAMSPDAGTNTAAFTGPFAYGKLTLASNTYVRLVDLSDNSPGTNAEALYVTSLTVPAGCTLDLNGLHVFTRASQISGVTTNGSVSQIPDSGPIVLGNPTSGAISVAGELDEWTFFGRAGKSATIVVDTGSDSVLSPRLNFAEVRLFDPFTNLLARASNVVAGQVVALTDVTLPTNGAYRIQIRAPATHSDSTGNYQITIWDTTPDVAPLVLNQTMYGRIETPYSVDRWTFSALAGTQVQFDLVNASATGVAFDLRGATGPLGFTNLIGDSGLVNLPADGNYTITAHGMGGAYDIAYAFKLVETTQTPLSIGDTFTGQFTGSGQAQIFLVTVTNSGPLRITLNGGAAGNRTELYVARGNPATRGAFDFSSSASGSNQSLLIPSATAGTLYILVYGDYVPTPGPFTIQVTAAGVYLTDIVPNRHANNVGFVMTLSGAGFESGTTVELLAGGGVPAVAATNVSVDSFTQLTAFFPTNAAPTGLYSVRVREPDGDTAILTNAFEIPTPGAPILRTKLILPGALGRHALATLYVEYANIGTVSMPAPLIQVRSSDPDGSDRPLLTLKQHRLSDGFWTSTLPDGFGHSVAFLASGQQAGFLHPGERIRVPIYYAGLLQPWDFNDNKVELGLTVVETTDPRPMNWAGITYGTVVANLVPIHIGVGDFCEICGGFIYVPIPSQHFAIWVNGVVPTEDQLRQMWFSHLSFIRESITDRFDEPGVLQLRPDSISETAWSGIVTNLRASVGETLGDWVRALGENASYLARHGQPNNNIDDLWRFEVLQASGLGPVPVLDAVTDASMVTPGVGLSLSRGFPNSIPARHVLGPFGYGWTFSWNLKLTVETNGLVLIGSCCGGTQRRYEPDIRTPGKYFSMPGDTATLTTPGNGTFELRDPNGTVTRFAASGLLDTVEDPNGNRVTAGYDGLSRLHTLAHTSGATLTIDYNGSGRIEKVFDSAGRTNSFTFDPAGEHLETVTTADGKTTVYTYQTTGDARRLHALTSIQRGGTTQHFTYDSRGRLESTYRGANEQLIQFGYDSAGTVFVADSLGTNSLFYNESGLLTKVVDPLSHITTSEFDNDFRLKKLVLPTGESQSFAWSDAGNLLGLTDEAGHSTSFNYEPAFNRLASFTDAKLNTTRYTYDLRGNLASTIYPNQSVERFGNYTSAGLPLAHTNRRDQPLSYQYNAAGQITNQVFTNGSSIQFAYDARGNLTNTTSGTNVTTYVYDFTNHGDRLKKVIYPKNRFLEYDYDSFGRRRQMTDQDGFATKYEYDSAGRLWKLRDENDTLLVTYNYDASGRLKRIDKGNGTFTTYDYDAAGQLLHLTNSAPNGSVNSRFDYTYDRRGRRTSMSTLHGDWTYGYGAIGQLTRAVFDSTNPQIPDQDLTYEYDALGNRVRTIENGVTNAYVANNLNQYTSVAGSNHQYDADGNLTFDGVNTYEWDQQSRLVRVTGSSGVTEYQYDAFGNRLARLRDGQRVEYVIDDIGSGDVVTEIPVGPSSKVRTVHGFGMLGRGSAGGSLNYFEFDGTATTVGISGDTGSDLNRYNYDPFGNVIASAGIVQNPYEFMGQYGVTTEGIGLNFTRARLLATKHGRFMQVDPSRFLGSGANLYAYTRNSPINWNDSTGESQTAGFSAFWRDFKGGREYLRDQGIGFVWGLWQKWAIEQMIEEKDRRLILENEEKYRNLDPADKNYYPRERFYRLTIEELRRRYEENRRRYREGPRVDYPNVPSTKDEILNAVSATDPNEKRGPSGFDAANFLAPGAPLPYRIKFENFGPGTVDANGTPFPSQVWASAPAQEVEITDALSPALDWSTLRFTGFGFGDTIRALEPPRSYFQTILPVTINGTRFEVHFEASLDLATGRLRAVFRSIDPQTSLPPEVLTGFLPPEDGTGRGQGFIEYTVEPRAGLPTGTQIRNVALISFDRQPSIATDQIDPLNPAAGSAPAKQTLVTIDAGAPASSVSALPSESGRAFVVQWSGQDDAGGSGIASYDVFVSTNGSMFVSWFSNITATSAVFIGELGKTYAFYSISRDNVGNVELPPVAPDAVTLVITNAPLIIGVTNQLADVGGSLVISNMVSGAAATNFVWSVVGPAGVTINSSNGVLRWTPSCSQGSTTNVITVWATDRIRTNLSDVISIVVAVKECVAPTLGRLVLRAGDTGRLPINLITSVPLTNLATFVKAPSERFTNLNVEPLLAEICTNGIQSVSNSLYLVTLTTCSNSLVGTQQIAWLVLTALTNQHSAFVPVEIGPSTGTQPDGTMVTNYVVQSGRVVVVGEEPLLEALRSTNSLVQLILYAVPGATNVLERSVQMPPQGSWLPWQQVVPTNLFQPLSPSAPSNQTLFIRALRP